MNQLGDTLRDLRESMGYSLKVVSKGIDEKIDYLGKVERGERTPTAGFIRKLQEFYTVEDNSLLHLYYSDIILELLELEIIDKKELLRIAKKRLDNPDYQIPIKRKEKPTSSRTISERKLHYLDEYTRNGKLTPKVREILLTKGKSIMEEGGADLDTSLSDEELINEWNEWIITEGFKSEETKEWYEDYHSKKVEREQEEELRKQKRLKELGLYEEDTDKYDSDKLKQFKDKLKGFDKWK